MMILRHVLCLWARFCLMGLGGSRDGWATFSSRGGWATVLLAFCLLAVPGGVSAQDAEAQAKQDQAAQPQDQAEPKLKFNFRFQKWAEVLDWMADEAELSLVMDEPPPGTFNYSDSKEYTPTEAIDLLNGWLLTKGYTLVRRERLLMCLSLKGGLPDNAIPQVTPEDLATRGRFEFVSTLIPLEGRPAEVVLTEIKPLLGTYGKAEVLAATQQLMVVDSAASVRTIARVVEQVPIPDKPKPVTPPPPAPKAELVVYPIQHANPTQAGEVLKTIIEGTLVVDEAASQISINAIPDEQAKAKIIIGQLESNQGPDKQPALKMYPARPSSAVEMLATLGLIAPTAQFRYDESSRRLVAWATPAEQQRIAASMEELALQQPATGPVQLEVYPLEKISPDAAQTLITSLLPDARITLDTKTGSLIAIASRSDHQAITDLLLQLEPQHAGTLPAELKTYPAEDIDVSSVTSLLATLAPDAQVTPDSAGQRLLVIAGTDDHQVVENVLQQVADRVPSEKPQLKSYPLSPKVSAETLTSLLSTLTPQAAVTSDTANRRLLITATPEEHTTIAAAIDELAQNAGGEQPELQFYPLQKASGSNAATVLQAMLPAATITFEPEGKRLSVVAGKSDHEVVQATLAKLEATAPVDEKRTLKIFEVTTEQRRRFTSVLESLSTELPGLQVLTDAQPGEMTVWARPSQLEIVSEVLNQLQREVAPEDKPQLVVYPIRQVDPASVATVLTELFPDAKITTDEVASRLLVHARQAVQQTIKAAIEQLDSSVTTETQIKLMVYPVKGVDAVSALQLLNTEVPKATVIHDTTAGTFIVRARLEQHQEVASLLDALQSAAAPLSKRTAVVYPTSNSKASIEQAFFESAFPNAKFVFDPIAKTMTALANSEEHASISEAVQAMSQDGGTAAELKEYRVAGSEIAGVSRLLTETVPNAQVVFSGEKLLAWAIPAEHTTIGRIVTSVQKPAVSRRIEAFDITKVELSNAQTVLKQVAPEVNFLTSSDGRSLVAMVDEFTRNKVATALQQLAESPAAADKRQLRFYDIATAGGTQAQTVLSTAVPEVTFTATQDGQRLLALVSESDHERITATLQQLAEEKPFAADSTLQLYSIKDAGPNATTVLGQAVPAASISTGASPDQIAVVAKEQDHTKLASVLEQLQAAHAEPVEKELVVYDITGSDASAVQSVLQPMISADVTVTVDPKGRQLYVRAFPEDHATVKRTIEQITESLKPDADLETKTYVVGRPNADEAQEVLLALYPDATIVIDADRSIIVATATAEQHVKIAEISEQIATSGTNQNPAYPVVYQVQNVAATQAESLLSGLFSRFDGVRFSVNERSGRLIAVARKDQHQVISGLLEQFDGEPAPEVRRDLAVYRVVPLDALTVKTALEPLVSDQVLISADRRGSEILVSAPPEDQEKIAELVQQMTSSRASGAGMETRTYRLPSGDATAARTALSDMFPEATLVTDRLAKVLIATASADQHETIRTVVSQLTDSTIGGEGFETKAYRMQNGDAQAAQSALRTLLPEATLVTDRRDRMLVATATPEQHTTIAAIVQQLNGEGLGDDAVPRSYRLNQADGETVVDVLDDLFRRDDEVRLSLDEANQTVVAIARPEQHQLITTMLADLDPKDGVAAYTLQVYAVPDLDQPVIRDVIEELLTERIPASSVHLETATGSLLVTTNNAGHEMTQAALQRFGTPEPREMEVFQLSYLETWTAQSAIESMLGSRFTNELSAPVVQADEDTQQLWVRGTRPQLQDIRTLLTKMGEVGLAAKTDQPSNPNLRIIPIGSDVTGTLKRVQDLWPKVRSNPIRILQPANAPNAGQFSVPPEAVQKSSAAKQQADEPVDTDETVEAQAADPKPDDKPATRSAPREQQANAGDAAAKANADAADDDQLPPTVVIVPGADRLTIASDDVEALNQLESILRAMHSRSAGGRNRDFGVYQLTNAGASDVATTLQQIFDDRTGLMNFGQVVMVPDERLNALIVYGSRTDRGRIEQLLEVLDSEKYEDTSRAFQTEVVPLQYASARRVENVIQGVYRAQMTAGGARSNIAIPKGVPSDVASVLRQINAAASSPLLTVETQEDTNSLVLKAPREILTEVKDLIARLDEASQTSRARGVTLLPLKKASSARVMRILNDVLD